MHLQLTQKRIVSTVLIGTMAVTIGSIHAQPAAAQLDRNTFREAASELGLSRSQTRDVAGIVRGFNDELQEILTPEQLEILQSAREDQQSQPQDLQALQASLNLTETQTEQISTARASLDEELREILTPEQLAGLIEIAGFDQF